MSKHQLYSEMFDRIPVEPMPLEEFIGKMAEGTRKRTSDWCADHILEVGAELAGKKWDVQHSICMKMEREFATIMKANAHNQLGMEHTCAWTQKSQVEQIRKFLEGKLNTERL